MTKRTYFISLTVVLAGIAGALWYAGGRTTQSPLPPVTRQPVATSSAPVIPRHAPTTIRSASLPPTEKATTTPATVSIPSSFAIPVTEHGTVLAAMQAFASSTSFTFTGREYPSLGFFVESIGGKSNADGMYWMLYVNGAVSSLGASQQEVTPGDTVEWRYEKSY